jgi:hypothetical protein
VSHKHVVMTAWDASVYLDDDDNPQTLTVVHEAVMDVEESQLKDFLEDARTRWMKIDVSDECPEHCTAQLATPEHERDARLQKAVKLREDYHDKLQKDRVAYEKANS